MIGNRRIRESMRLKDRSIIVTVVDRRLAELNRRLGEMPLEKTIAHFKKGLFTRMIDLEVYEVAQVKHTKTGYQITFNRKGVLFHEGLEILTT